MMAAFSKWGREQWWDKVKKLPIHDDLMEGFNEWLDHFNHDTWKLSDGDFGCYNPYNLQTRGKRCMYIVIKRTLLTY